MIFAGLNITIQRDFVFYHIVNIHIVLQHFGSHIAGPVEKMIESRDQLAAVKHGEQICSKDAAGDCGKYGIGVMGYSVLG